MTWVNKLVIQSPEILCATQFSQQLLSKVAPRICTCHKNSYTTETECSEQKLADTFLNPETNYYSRNYIFLDNHFYTESSSADL